MDGAHAGGPRKVDKNWASGEARRGLKMPGLIRRHRLRDAEHNADRPETGPRCRLESPRRLLG